MRLLPEEERVETLAILARNKVDVERALQVSLSDCRLTMSALLLLAHL